MRRQVFGFEQCVLHVFVRLRSYGVVPSAGAEASDLCGVPPVQFTTRLRHVRAGQDLVLLLPRMSVPLGHRPTRTVRPVRRRDDDSSRHRPSRTTCSQMNIAPSTIAVH